jgi:hypothetical protein
MHTHGEDGDEHLRLALADYAAGEQHHRNMAGHIAAALACGKTQLEIAQRFEKSQGWVSRVVKWQRSGYTRGGPWAGDKKQRQKNISLTNNRAKLAAQLSRALTDCDAYRAYLEQAADHGDIKHFFSPDDAEKAELLLAFIKKLRRVALVEAA